MNALLLVIAGGGIGAGLRHLLGRAAFALAGPGWPTGTLAANLLGALAMGLLAGALARYGAAVGDAWRLFVGVGLLGGFTTFSAFSLESVGMIQRGQFTAAALYAVVSVVGSIAALFAGLAAMRPLA